MCYNKRKEHLPIRKSEGTTLKKTALRIGAGYLAILLLTLAAVLLTGGTYTAYINNLFNSDRITVEYETEGIVENTQIKTVRGVTAFTFRAVKPCDTTVVVTIFSEKNDTDRTMMMLDCHVLPTGVVYLKGYDFGGHAFVVAGLALLTLYSFAIYFKQFRIKKKTQFFSYKTVLDLGLTIFFGLLGAMYFALSCGAFLIPDRFEGRIDKALSFYREQSEATGKQARFIPSGGQGSDEVISEAQSIKEYLIAHGVDESMIFPEDASTNTLENMKNSKAIADAQKPDANIVFSTTNYHVFRSGILSAKAGMRAQGIGAKTKWYFWPNAQMREFIGLMASEWKINALIIASIVGFSTLLANISTIINLIV